MLYEVFELIYHAYFLTICLVTPGSTLDHDQKVLNGTHSILLTGTSLGAL